MGLMDKFKNLFTEEVTEEKPIKKEVRHVEIPAPKREVESEKREDRHISDSSAIQKDEKFVFPVYFDDKDFDDLEKPKEVRRKKRVEEKPKTEAYSGSLRKEISVENQKNFKPSLIISPVYGVLDKNYHKDDIMPKHSVSSTYYKKSDHITIDDIRDKAYGTLEDELKNNILGNEELLLEKKENTDTAIDLFNELDFEELDKKNEQNKTDQNVNNSNSLLFEDSSYDDDTAFLAQQLEEQKRKLDAINDYIKENTVEKKNEEETSKVEEEKEDAKEEETSLEETPQEKVEDSDLTESELFNLIDSMYEDKEEE